MLPERLHYLIDRFLAGDASDKERAELAGYLHVSSDDDETLRQALESIWMQYEPDVRMPEEMSARILGSLRVTSGARAPGVGEGMAVAGGETGSMAGHRGRVGSLLMSRRIAAAAAIVVVCAGVYWLTRSSKVPASQPVAVVKAKDIAPGGNKAILTLGNGQTIVLDSAANGVLARQGSATVTKLAGGQLAYTAGADAGASGVAGTDAKAAAKGGDSGTGAGNAGGTVVYNTMATPAGGQYRLTLPDGTGVWLNSTSSITYPTSFSGKERLVRITGEAYFEVARNKDMPFRVETGNLSVQVLGTSFNINAYKDEASINTTLVEGAVKVSNRGREGGKEQLLQPGQQARVSGDGNITWVRQADVEQAVAWKNSIFSFRDADIRTVMRQLSRWYNVEVTFAGNAPGGSFSGEIGRGLTLAQVLNGLSQEKIHYQIEEGNKIVIQP